MRKFNFGRSMIEMLAVLAIVGILSIGGLALYQLAMNKYKATSMLNDVITCSKSVLTADPYYMLKGKTTNDKEGYDGYHEWLFSGLTNYGRTGSVTKYEMHTVASDKHGYVYRVIVKDVPKKVCKLALQYQPTITAIYVKGKKFIEKGDGGNEDEICSLNENDITFYFDKRLEVS